MKPYFFEYSSAFVPFIFDASRYLPKGNVQPVNNKVDNPILELNNRILFPYFPPFLYFLIKT